MLRLRLWGGRLIAYRTGVPPFHKSAKFISNLRLSLTQRFRCVGPFLQHGSGRDEFEKDLRVFNRCLQQLSQDDGPSLAAKGRGCERHYLSHVSRGERFVEVHVQNFLKYLCKFFPLLTPNFSAPRVPEGRQRSSQSVVTGPGDVCPPPIRDLLALVTTKLLDASGLGALPESFKLFSQLSRRISWSVALSCKSGLTIESERQRQSADLEFVDSDPLRFSQVPELSTHNKNFLRHLFINSFVGVERGRLLMKSSDFRTTRKAQPCCSQTIGKTFKAWLQQVVLCNGECHPLCGKDHSTIPSATGNAQLKTKWSKCREISIDSGW